MKNSSHYLTLVSAAFAAALIFSPITAKAQNVTAPVVVKNPSTNSPKVKAKGEWIKGEVIHADATSIVFREQENGMSVHTFTFDPSIQDRMRAIADSGGYQYGDRIKILHQHGQTVALKISGRPSKPS